MFERCLYFNANRLARRVNRIWEQAYGELGLAPAHAYLLRLVLARPGLAQRDIAAELTLEKSTVTRFVDKMVQAGYLERRSPPSGNQREQCIYPTAKAKRITVRLQTIGDTLYRQMQEVMGKETLIDTVGLIRDTTTKL